MAQHDHDIANAAGATFRADLNLALAAIVSNNSGAAAPSPTFAHMWWPDTTTDILKRRNAANSAWMELLHFDETNGLFRIDFDKGADIASAATTDISAATGNYATITGTTTITALGTIKAGVSRLVRFSGALTLTHNGTSLILPGGASITTAAGDMMLALSEGSGNWRVAFYQKASGQAVDSPISVTKAPPTISNNATDATNDIDIAAGKCRDDADTANLVVASAIGKQIDVTWASGGTPGTPTGGLSSSLTLTNDTWYHVFLGLVAGTVEAGFDTSVTAANLIADHSFSNVRRIGSVRRLTAANKLFTQIGDRVLWTTPVLEVSAQAMSTGSQTLRTLMCPPGVRTEVEFNYMTSVISGSGTALYFRTPDTTDSAPSDTVAPLHTNDYIRGNAATTASSGGKERVITNTSSQIAERSSQAGNISIATISYLDRRGRDG